MANNISLSEILHTRPAVVPTIYGYILPDLSDHDGYIKIGYTDRDVETRIREQLHIGNASGRHLLYGQGRAQTVKAQRLFTVKCGRGQERVVQVHPFGRAYGG